MPKILVVDDHPAICFAAKAVLEHEKDFEVVTSHGGQLLNLIRQHAPQLLILDIALDNEDGLLLIPRIRQHYPECKILIHSGLSVHLYAERALRAGAEGFISKQTSLNDLLPACHLILKGYVLFPAQSFTLPHTVKYGDRQAFLAALSNRELVVLRLFQEGKTNKAIAEQLTLSHKTISTYKARILDKSAATSFDQLIVWLQGDSHAK
ncbi:response regulator [Pantoea sp. RRHST58]|uniref:response regulator n=1 Tax=Pantoea sp. RRHST58 TaxID=3425183 RepID=UPI003DA027E7